MGLQPDRGSRARCTPGSPALGRSARFLGASHAAGLFADPVLVLQQQAMDADAHPWPQHGSGAPLVVDDPPAEGRIRRGFGAVGFILDSIRRRRSGRITLWSLVVGLTLGGVYPIA